MRVIIGDRDDGLGLGVLIASRKGWG